MRLALLQKEIASQLHVTGSDWISSHLSSSSIKVSVLLIIVFSSCIDEYDGSVKSTLRLTFYFNTDSFQDAAADSAAPCWVWDEL